MPNARRLRLLLAAALAAGGAAAAGPPKATLAPGFGVTPGGLVWTVEPSARRLVLRDPSGAERGFYPLAADEGHVLGVADSGSRVTAPTPDGFRRRPARAGAERTVEARYVFRFPDGAVRATVPTTALRGSEPAFLGDEAWIVRPDAKGWAVARIAPDGETAAARIEEGAVKRAVGRPSAPRLSAGPSGVALLFRGARGDAAVRADRPSTVFVPDPLASCGEGRPSLALPHEAGILVVSVRTRPAEDLDDGGEPLAFAELFDEAGRLLRSVPLGPFGELFPLPDGGLLGLDGREAVRFDDRFAEAGRGVLPLEEGADPEAAARVVEQLRRLEALGPRASGADWAELALLPGAPLGRFVERARSDPAGALARLARSEDGSPESLEAAKALPFLLDALRPSEAAPLLDRLAGTPADAPAWLRTSAAFALLAASPVDAPSWALPAAAEAIAAGTAPEGQALPDEAFTLPLAELVTAVDRARIERAVRERPELLDELLSGNLDEAFAGGISELRFHAPAARFARTLLDCTAGPPSAVGVLALARVTEAALEEAGGPPPGAPAGASDAAGGEASGRGEFAGTLLEARTSPDAGLRASALVLGPLAGLPIDAGAFRSEVLRRPHLGAFAFLGLVTDRSLPAKTWQGLFLDLFFGARSASADPSACTLTNGPYLAAEGDSSSDRYCNLFAFVHFAALDLGGEDDPALVSRERIDLLREFARSSSAPPELRLDLKLGRAMRGSATEEEVLELLGERELPPVFRRIVLTRVPAGSARVASFLERELSSGRVATAERGLWLDVLSRLDAPAADRVAAEAWARGTVPLDGDEETAGAFASALSTDRVRESEPLRAALRRARAYPGAGADAAIALARAGDAGAAGPLVEALLESCPGCRTADELDSLFGPLGEEGIEGLARLAGAALPFTPSPLEALFGLAPERAEALARDRLAAALEGGCVPEPLLPVLFAHGIDPFLPILQALEARGCDRARLRPGEAVAAGIARAPGTDLGRAARAALDAAAPSCRRAFASLLGIEADARGGDAP